MKRLIGILGIVIIVIGFATFFLMRQRILPNGENTISPFVPSTTDTMISPPPLKEPPAVHIIPQKTHVFQSFNNCGPASLSMALSYMGIAQSQEELGQELRPYQNPQGDNDDKSVTLEELARKGQSLGLLAYHLPNGDTDLLKQLIAQDIPIVTRTWLHPGEDIGHYRLVRGYDDRTMEFIQDDSYEGQNLRFSYDSFLSLWQAFNYEYLILVSPDKKNVVEQILQDQKNPSVAWKLAYTRALQESEDQPENIYPLFNQSVALYHLGEYQKSIETYELVAGRLPRRMLWYQLQPIQSYLEIGSYDKVYTLTGQILNNENRGYSELYLIRGDAYLRQGDRERAREEYERAVFYNQNLSEAQQALESLVNTIE